jgi:hypothetical protein
VNARDLPPVDDGPPRCVPSWRDESPYVSQHLLHPAELEPGDVLLDRNDDEVVVRVQWVRAEPGDPWRLHVVTDRGGHVLHADEACAWAWRVRRRPACLTEVDG